MMLRFVHADLAPTSTIAAGGGLDAVSAEQLWPLLRPQAQRRCYFR